jgi:hypothetical protein
MAAAAPWPLTAGADLAAAQTRQARAPEREARSMGAAAASSAVGGTGRRPTAGRRKAGGGREEREREILEGGADWRR